MSMLNVQDVVTSETFRLDPTENVAFIKTKDGFRVKLHPLVIKNMIGVGEEFEGQTTVGPRRMKKLKEVTR